MRSQQDISYVMTNQVEQYDQYTIDNDEILPVNGFRLVR